MRRWRWLWLLLLWCAVSYGGWAQAPEVRWVTTQKGSGRGAAMGDQVAMSYTLKLANGTLIETTPEGTSFRMRLGDPKLIPGLSQGLLGIQRGEIRQITIPPEWGYGYQDVGPIPAGSTLLFQVSLHYFIEDRGDVSLSEQFGRDGYENRPDARNLDKPAMFEFLIRDFFTRPWRYPDAPLLVWKANAVLTLLTLALWGVRWWRRRRS